MFQQNLLTFRRLYITLVLLQVAHSFEEYFTRFYERIGEGSSLLHGAVGFVPVFQFSHNFFVIVNVVLITTIIALIEVVNQGGISGRCIATLLAVIETLNGVAHLTIAVMMRAYFPGALTAPFLLVVGVFMLRQVFKPMPMGAQRV
jgi:hypothetical protein